MAVFHADQTYYYCKALAYVWPGALAYCTSKMRPIAATLTCSSIQQASKHPSPLLLLLGLWDTSTLPRRSHFHFHLTSQRSDILVNPTLHTMMSFWAGRTERVRVRSVGNWRGIGNPKTLGAPESKWNRMPLTCLLSACFACSF